jgi:hypothetical protein
MLDEYSETVQNRYHIPFQKFYATLRSTISPSNNIYWSFVFRLPDIEEQQPELYKKDKGAARIHGSVFKDHLYAIIYIVCTSIHTDQKQSV